MDNKRKNIEPRSRETQEIMNNKPPFIVRWGMTIILLLMVGFIAVLLLTQRPHGLYTLMRGILHLDM